MQIEFSGKTAIVTGAAHGFGRAISVAFASRGAHVWACDVLEDELRETQRLCAEAGGKCEVRRVDVSDKAAVDAFVAEASAADRPGRHPGEQRGRRARAGGQAARRGHAGAVAEHLRRQRDRRVLFLPGGRAGDEGRTRTAGSSTSRAAPGWASASPGIQAYASAKAAQIGLTRQLAHELGPWGITVNNIAPGFVRSNPTTERQWESYGAEGQAALVDKIALKRLGTPDDIAYGVLFFASDYAGWITGQVISIDGGK